MEGRPSQMLRTQDEGPLDDPRVSSQWWEIASRSPRALVEQSSGERAALQAPGSRRLFRNMVIGLASSCRPGPVDLSVERVVLVGGETSPTESSES